MRLSLVETQPGAHVSRESEIEYGLIKKLVTSKARVRLPYSSWLRAVK